MFMRRRRPLMRAAMVGGTAYAVGKHSQANQQEDEYQEQRLQALEAQQAQQAAPPPAAAAPGGIAPSSIEQLKELAQLKDQGVLTEDEFAAQKQKILGGG